MSTPSRCLPQMLPNRSNLPLLRLRIGNKHLAAKYKRLKMLGPLGPLISCLVGTASWNAKRTFSEGDGRRLDLDLRRCFFGGMFVVERTGVLCRYPGSWMLGMGWNSRRWKAFEDHLCFITWINVFLLGLPLTPTRKVRCNLVDRSLLLKSYSGHSHFGEGTVLV